MKIITAETAAAASKETFNIIADRIQHHQLHVLGLATGSTPCGLYRLLCASHLAFRQMTSVNLDEYVGLQPTDPQSYYYFMQAHLFRAKPFKESFFPDGTNLDAAAVTKEYDQVLAAHPLDLQVLGIGQNGHIGFNEPGTSFTSRTHRVVLTPWTIAANARFFARPDEVPRTAYTMGIASIMAAKQVVLMAFGAQKAPAIRQAVKRPVTPAVPASVLQRHPNVTLILDRAAASQL